MESKSVLTATDFSENARGALCRASEIAKRRAVPLTVLHCLEWVADLPSWHGALTSETTEQYRERALEQLETEFEEVVPAAKQPSQVRFDVAVEFPENELVERLENGDFGLAVIGATGLNRVANFFLGSVPEDVVRRSSVPVLVVPGDIEAEPFERIVAPVDFSPCSKESLEGAAALAREYDASLTVLHGVPVMADIQAVPTPGGGEAITPEDREDARADRLGEFLADADLGDIDWESRQRVGSPHDVIVDAVEDIDADLVVMGTHGRRGFERLFLGSTATKVLRRMPCSVMTIRSE